MTPEVRHGLYACALACVLSAATAWGVTEPPSVLLNNYDRALIGSQGALEGGAILCRAKAAEAAWFNPAGVVRGTAFDINGNATVYELVNVGFTAEDVNSEASVLNTIPVFVGSSAPITTVEDKYATLSWGFAIVTPVTWEMSLNSYDEVIDPAFPTAVNQISSSSSSSIDTVAMGGTISYAKSARFTMGASGFIYNTAINRAKSRFDDWWDGTGVGSASDTWTFVSSNLVDIQTTTLGVNLGMFYKIPSGAVETAVVARLPIYNLSAVGTLDSRLLSVKNETLDPVDDVDIYTGVWDEYQHYQRDAHETEVPVEWRIPAQIDAGIAFRWGPDRSQQLEFDINYHAATGTYEVFPDGIYYVRRGTYGDPTIPDDNVFENVTEVRPGLTTTGRAITNFGVGYRWEITQEKRFHAGLRTSFSPVIPGTDAEDLFAPIDMYLFTVGMSSQTTNTFTSMGIVVGFGGTESWQLRDLATYDLVDGSLSIYTLSFVMGASFKL